MAVARTAGEGRRRKRARFDDSCDTPAAEGSGPVLGASGASAPAPKDRVRIVDLGDVLPAARVVLTSPAFTAALTDTFGVAVSVLQNRTWEQSIELRCADESAVEAAQAFVQRSVADLGTGAPYVPGRTGMLSTVRIPVGVSRGSNNNTAFSITQSVLGEECCNLLHILEECDNKVSVRLCGRVGSSDACDDNPHLEIVPSAMCSELTLARARILCDELVLHTRQEYNACCARSSAPPRPIRGE
eukprot:Hpha_TRINITY_DN14228_c0_g1::TRINITY_DN14228_c0_g1_i1::g.22824::m.22824